jgi:hypothetical protein
LAWLGRRATHDLSTGSVRAKSQNLSEPWFTSENGRGGVLRNRVLSTLQVYDVAFKSLNSRLLLCDLQVHHFYKP